MGRKEVIKVVNVPKKAPSTAELREAMARLLSELEVDNAWLLMGKAIEQQPVAERLKNLLDTMEQLDARGEKVPVLDIRNWEPKLVGELELDPRGRRVIGQMRLKDALLRKHGREKLEAVRARKRTKQRGLPGRRHSKPK